MPPRLSRPAAPALSIPRRNSSFPYVARARLKRLRALRIVLEKADGLDEIGVRVASPPGSSAVVNMRYGVADKQQHAHTPIAE